MALPLSYHWRNLFVRKTTTILTVLVIAAVVAVFAWMIGFAGALSRSLDMASDEHKLIVMKRGSTAESTSAIPADEYSKLAQLVEVERNGAGEPLQSPEMLVQVSLPRVRDGGRTAANVAVRGVTEAAFDVHRGVRIIEGRRFNPGSLEVIAGSTASRQFAGLRIGDTVSLGYGGNRGYLVVGIFSANGAPMDSEIWGPLTVLMNSYNRTMYSSANLRLREGANSRSAIEQIEGPSIQLSGKTEPQYWDEQSRNVRFYLKIAYTLVGIMSVAAVFSIANTMFAAVAGRTREIAMLRTIGYSGEQILWGFILESLLLSVAGGILGCIACAGWLALAGGTKDMFGANTFTTMGFEIRMTPVIVVLALAMVAVVGVLGAYFPARRAARLQVIHALREP
jgi:putative ABC transport system permease protein